MSGSGDLRGDALLAGGGDGAAEKKGRRGKLGPLVEGSIHAGGT